MEDRRCKLGLQGRLELVSLVENGLTLRAAAAALSVVPATAHRWWHRWQAASEAERASRECLRTRSTRPKSCPWALSAEQEQAILDARARTNWGPMRLTWLTGLSDEVCVVVVSDLGLCAGPPETGAPKGRAALAARRAAREGTYHHEHHEEPAAP